MNNFSIDNLSHSCNYDNKKITFIEWLNIGIELIKLNYLSDALFAFEKGLKENPSYIPLLLKKAEVLQKLNKIDDAIVLYKNILKIEVNKQAFFNLGILYFLKKNYKCSIHYYSKLLDLGLEDPKILYNYALALEENHNLKEAYFCYNSILKKDPSFEIAWFNKGLLAVELGYIDEGIECFTKVILISNNNYDAWFNRGYLYSIKEDFDDALYDFFKSIELNKSYYKSYEEIGYIYLQMGFLNDALKYFEKSISLCRNTDSLFGKYYCLKKMNKINEANIILKEICDMDPHYKKLKDNY